MKKFRIKLLIISFLSASIVCRAQSNYDKTTFNSRTHIELMVLPALVFNSVSLGISRHISEKREQAITLSSQFVYMGGNDPYFASATIRYNYNIYFAKPKRFNPYIPLWCGSRFMYFSGGEERSFSSQTIFYTVGTGIGLKCEFENGHKIRFELGVGGSMFSTRIPFKSSDFDLRTDSRVIALRAGVKYLIPIGRKRN